MELVFLGAPRDEGATKMNVNKNDSALHCSWPFFSCTTEFTSWLSVFLPVFFFRSVPSYCDSITNPRRKS